MNEKLMTVAEYRDLRFVGENKPHCSTIKRWIQSGDLPGVKIGGMYFVDVANEDFNDEIVDILVRGR